MKGEGVEMAKLQSNLAENKEASKELEKSLENLEAATKKVEGNKG
jgi:hypothetical protein